MLCRQYDVILFGTKVLAYVTRGGDVAMDSVVQLSHAISVPMSTGSGRRCPSFYIFKYITGSQSSSLRTC